MWAKCYFHEMKTISANGSDVPKGGHGGHGPSLSALGGPLRPRNIFSKQWIKRLLGRKMYIKVSFMYPWLPEGPLMTQWALQSSEGPWFPGPLVAKGAPDNLGAPSRAGGPLLGKILGTCLANGFILLSSSIVITRYSCFEHRCPYANPGIGRINPSWCISVSVHISLGHKALKFQISQLNYWLVSTNPQRRKLQRP